MRVSELMSPHPITVAPTASVVEARRIMHGERIRHLLVMDGDALIGMVTDRDVKLNLPSPATSLSVWEINHLLAKMTVTNVMTRPVIVVAPDVDARDAAAMLLAEKIGALPVVDGGRLVGIVTETDFLRAFVGAPVLAAAE